MVAHVTRRWLSPIVIGLLLFHALAGCREHGCCGPSDDDLPTCELPPHFHDAATEGGCPASDHPGHHEPATCGFAAMPPSVDTGCSAFAEGTLRSPTSHVAGGELKLRPSLDLFADTQGPSRAVHLDSSVLRI